jgi:lipopolysaccharide transport system permease protein
MSLDNRIGLTDQGLKAKTKAIDQQTTVIESSQGWSTLGLRDLWEYRELTYFLVVREIQGVYRQTALGISWIFLRPIINTLLLTLVFGNLVKVPSDNVPYALFSMSALIPWGYFSNAVMRTSRSLVDNTQVISKVYFPRMVLPLAGSISGLVDMGASLIVFSVLFTIYRMPLRTEMLWLPGLIVVTIASALAAGLWLATLAVKYRDVSFAITFLLQGLMYLSPVIYPISMVPNSLKFLYQLNPMTGVIQGFRWALLGNSNPPGVMFWVDVVIIVVGLVSGAYLFRRTERTIVDIL